MMVFELRLGWNNWTRGEIYMGIVIASVGKRLMEFNGDGGFMECTRMVCFLLCKSHIEIQKEKKHAVCLG
ncbi:hypothetical protein L6452_33949 [Arctium lappa]|uniref:Uncharacterized protein n=1 Tax=Arctium lappa TaxID=4217 RepID=A0ACB8YHE5_ARCLA|nr:hypothetical protein L6452_33949 [Arctium lappa]